LANQGPWNSAGIRPKKNNPAGKRRKPCGTFFSRAFSRDGDKNDKTFFVF